MPIEAAVYAVALRSSLEALIVRSTSDPESIANPPPEEAEIMDLIRQLSKPEAAGSNISPQEALERFFSLWFTKSIHFNQFVKFY